MDISTIKPYLEYQFKSESELLSSIETMNRNFTKDRGSIGEYLNDTKLASAYTCFYLLTNLPKLQAVLDKIGLDISEYNDWEFVDVGRGPGTFTVALKQINSDFEVSYLETSEVMNKQADKLISGLFKGYKSLECSKTKSKKRFAIFGHSANEMPLEVVLSYIEKYQFDKILFIEPGTKSFFKKSLDIRNTLIGQGHNILYPCASNNPCPLIDIDDWCHQYIKVSHSVEVERLCQMAKKDRRMLPLTIQYYAKDELPKHDAIITRTYPAKKYGAMFDVCQKELSSHKYFQLDVLFRKMSKSEKKDLISRLGGDRIRVTIEKDVNVKLKRGTIDVY